MKERLLHIWRNNRNLLILAGAVDVLIGALLLWWLL